MTRKMTSAVRKRAKPAKPDSAHAQASDLTGLGTLARAIAHEIYNPLTVIQGRCELIDGYLQGAAPDLEGVRTAVRMIDKMSRRINKTVRGMQAQALDHRDEELEAVDFREILRDALSLCAERNKPKTPAFEVQDLREPLILSCRPTQISQALVNLLNNACDEAADKAHGFVRVEVSVVGDVLEIAVVDSGAGIPKAVADKLFTPFFTTKPGGKGTGLGLSISRSLVEAHGGTLSLDRSSAHTRFVIRLPLAAAVAHAS